MENLFFWVLLLFAAITLYRLLSRRLVTPKARVAAMLRQYRALERMGLSEQECLLRLLLSRRSWKRLPQRFLAEIVSRLRSKEDVMRFVSVSEDYRYHLEHFPDIAKEIDLEAAMAEIACLFARFGVRLQAEGSLKEAEFVQKLALRLQANQYFTNLPLAATYHEAGRYSDALPLFERGLAQLKNFETNEQSVSSPAACLGHDAEIRKLGNHYREMYRACLKAAGGKLLCSVMFVEVVCSGGRLDLL